MKESAREEILRALTPHEFERLLAKGAAMSLEEITSQFVERQKPSVAETSSTRQR